MAKFVSSTGIARYMSHRFTSFRLYVKPVFQFTSQFSLVRALSCHKLIVVPVGK
jgi:hypothetical protein